jgi:hypothetical protein
LLGTGHIFGEEDAVKERPYSKSCICVSTTGVLFAAYADEFINQLKNMSEESYEYALFGEF